jgi:hypothetical protein
MKPEHGPHSTVKCGVIAKPAGTLDGQEMLFVICECSSQMDFEAT